MNKKIVLPMFAILAIGTVFALGYYGFFSTTFNVEKAIALDGDFEQSLGVVFTGESVIGTPITITNNAPSEREITISDNSGDDIITEYVAELDLAQKNVVFGSEPWTLLEDGETATLRYVAVGDEFKAEITDGIKEGYVLVYYKDNSDRFNSPADAIEISEISGNLPYLEDANTEENDYSEEYSGVAHGAKLWYIPETAIDSEGIVDWSQASNFLFETTLIQYNAEGELIVYPGQTLTLIPVYTPEISAEGEYTIETTVL